MRHGGALLAGLLFFTLGPVACEGRPRIARRASPSSAASATPPPSVTGNGLVLELNLSEGVPESTGSAGLFPIPASRGYVGLVRAIERVRDDDDATGVFVRLGTTSLGWAQTEELGGVIGKLRTKKPVVCHAHALDNATAWLAVQACDRIWLSPAGNVDTVGIAAEVVHVKGALDKLGVTADFLSMGKYKSAAEPVTREAPSDAMRESLGGALRSIRGTWLDGVARASKAPRARWLMEHGPWSAEEALSEKLIHSLGYESEARDDALTQAGAREHRVAYGPDAEDTPASGLAEVVRLLAGVQDMGGGKPSIAVVPAVGGITMEAGGLFSVEGIAAQSLQKTLKRLAKEDSVRAVVLRIDSPGGSALASDLLWRELRDLGAKKPLVASIGNMAASGGYYLACAARRVIAERTSIVGSIGVVGGKLVVGSALERYGIRPYVLPASDEEGAAARAAYLSALEPWDDETRTRVRAQMAHVYHLFRARVEEGRGLSAEKVMQSAEGRIWTGEQGLERGLIDELGGLQHALAVARKLAGLDERAAVIVEGSADSLLEALMMGEDANAVEAEAALRRYRQEQKDLARIVPLGMLPFLQSVSPFLGRESVVAALPFSVSIR